MKKYFPPFSPFSSTDGDTYVVAFPFLPLLFLGESPSSEWRYSRRVGEKIFFLPFFFFLEKEYLQIER